MTFEELRNADIERQETVGPFNSVAKLQSLLYWTTAIAGECGELCNLVKKQVRDEKDLSADIGKEIADVVIYADLLATRMGFRLEDLVRLKFNEVSDRRGSKIKL